MDNVKPWEKPTTTTQDQTKPEVKQEEKKPEEKPEEKEEKQEEKKPEKKRSKKKEKIYTPTPVASGIKVNKNIISDFYDDLENKDMQRRSFLLSDKVYQDFLDVVATYPSRIDKDILANYLIGQAKKTFCN